MSSLCQLAEAPLAGWSTRDVLVTWRFVSAVAWRTCQGRASWLSAARPDLKRGIRISASASASAMRSSSICADLPSRLLAQLAVNGLGQRMLGQGCVLAQAQT